MQRSADEVFLSGRGNENVGIPSDAAAIEYMGKKRERPEGDR